MNFILKEKAQQPTRLTYREVKNEAGILNAC
jgi:hypothetical protein